jgi:SAM-dependent methyltransferase
MMNMRIEPFPRERLMEAVSPYLKAVIPQASSEGRALCRPRRRGTLVATVQLGLQQVICLRRERSQEFTERFYSDSYADSGVGEFDACLAPSARLNPFKLGNESLLMLPPSGLFAAYLATLSDVIGQLKPSTICEVGFGSGKNLIYLAPRFPDIQLCGYELTHAGVALAEKLQKGESLPPNLAKLVGQNDATTMEAVRRIDFRQGNAKCLSATDKSFDLTFTVLALEQMWPILPRVLAEIRRVTCRYVVFIEAFREANDWLGYLNLLVRNYFRADLKMMRAAGFTPLALFRQLPLKHTHGVAMLVAEVMPTHR